MGTEGFFGPGMLSNCPTVKIIPVWDPVERKLVQRFVYRDLPQEIRMGLVSTVLQILSDHNGAWLWRVYLQTHGKTRNELARLPTRGGGPNSDRVMTSPYSYDLDFLKGFLRHVQA